MFGFFFTAPLLTWGAQKGSSVVVSSLEDQSSNSALSNNIDLRKAAVADLQKRWRCSFHSKDGKDTICWQSEGLCYEISISQLGYWAIEIVSPILCID